MPMFEQNYENWYILSQNGLSGPFWPFLCPNWSKWSIPSLFNLDSLETIRICIYRLIVPAKDDIFTKTISPPPDSYDSNTPPGHTG